MTSEGPRTYGNWLRPRSPGLGALGLGGTVAMLGGAVVVVIALAFSVVVGLVMAVLVAAGLAPLVIKDRWGRTGYARVGEWSTWLSHRRRKGHLYQAGPLARTPSSTCMLPGLAAAMTAFDAKDGHGRSFVVVHHPKPGHVSTVIECAPPGDHLVDPDQVDQWVASWGHWLGSLGQEAGLVAASVTVETAPDSGIRLEQAVRSRLVDGAPPMATAAMLEAMSSFGVGAASTRVFVALTWTRTREGARRRSVEDMAVEVGTRLPELTAGLEVTGAGRATPMTSNDLAAVLRVAFDPSVGPAVEAGDVTVDWSDAGPSQAEERAGEYLHDDAASVSWMMGEAPRGAGPSSLLRRLLNPHAEVDRKRVTLLYRPYEPATSARLVDSDVRDARFAATQRKVGRARDSVSVAAAERAAVEEALGASLVRFAVIVTATMVGDGVAELDRCRSVVESLGGSARIGLRPAHRAQATTFVAGLPLGLVLPAHVTLPTDWRDRG